MFGTKFVVSNKILFWYAKNRVYLNPIICESKENNKLNHLTNTKWIKKS